MELGIMGGWKINNSEVVNFNKLLRVEKFKKILNKCQLKQYVI